MTNFFDNKDRVGAFLILAFSLFYLRSSLSIPVDSFDAEIGFTSKTLPIFLGSCALVISLLLLFISFFQSEGQSISKGARDYDWKPVLALILLMAAYVMLFSYLGFVLASALFLQSAFALLGERRLLVGISVSLGLVLALWLLLTHVFGLYLDGGTLYRVFVS
jgi:putative tricarboxylic transport membrane protein